MLLLLPFSPWCILSASELELHFPHYLFFFRRSFPDVCKKIFFQLLQRIRLVNDDDEWWWWWWWWENIFSSGFLSLCCDSSILLNTIRQREYYFDYFHWERRSFLTTRFSMTVLLILSRITVLATVQTKQWKFCSFRTNNDIKKMIKNKIYCWKESLQDIKGYRRHSRTLWSDPFEQPACRHSLKWRFSERRISYRFVKNLCPLIEHRVKSFFM